LGPDSADGVRRPKGFVILAAESAASHMAESAMVGFE